MDKINGSELARRANCSRQAVSTAKREGRITPEADGRFDPEAPDVKAFLTAPRPPRIDGNAPYRRPVEHREENEPATVEIAGRRFTFGGDSPSWGYEIGFVDQHKVYRGALLHVFADRHDSEPEIVSCRTPGELDCTAEPWRFRPMGSDAWYTAELRTIPSGLFDETGALDAFADGYGKTAGTAGGNNRVEPEPRRTQGDRAVGADGQTNERAGSCRKNNEREGENI